MTVIMIVKIKSMNISDGSPNHNYYDYFMAKKCYGKEVFIIEAKKRSNGGKGNTKIFFFYPYF